MRARTGFGVIVVIATDATSAAFVKTSRRSTSSTVLRSSFSCCFRVDFKDDAHTKKGCGRLEDEGFWWCLLVDEKRLVVFLVGVEMTMLVAANMCRCVCVCVVVSASSFEAFTTRFVETKEESLSSFSDTLN